MKIGDKVRITGIEDPNNKGSIGTIVKHLYINFWGVDLGIATTSTNLLDGFLKNSTGRYYKEIDLEVIFSNTNTMNTKLSAEELEQKALMEMYEEEPAAKKGIYKDSYKEAEKIVYPESLNTFKAEPIKTTYVRRSSKSIPTVKSLF